MAQFALLGAAWKVAQGTKKCVEFLQSFQGIHEEGYILWHTIEAMQDPLQIAISLRCRHEAFRTLQHPLLLCSFLLQNVEKLIEKDEEEEGRPNDRESWARWIIHKKDGRQRKEQIGEILPRLTHVICTLNLALSSVQCKLDIRKITAGSAFYFVPDAFRVAHRLLLEFEYGRIEESLLCHGVLWKCEGHKKKAMMVEKGLCAVCLRKSDDVMSIVFVSIDEDDDPWDSETVNVTEETSFRCVWKSTVPDLDSEGEAIAFRLGDFWIEYYPADEGISAEAFEAVLTLVRMSSSVSESASTDSSDFWERCWRKNHEV
eukprot:GEMP01059732.1.p1 GENE.GEMP01059732.1~~GEMP01059732.1.p1  ORF type:complete len:327 (+),score=59.92 GEMP01059732.1:34-981(+)